MTFAQYLVLLQRQWRTWVFLLLLGALAATAFNALSPRMYTGVSTSFVTVADSANDGSSEIYQGSQFVVQRVKSYASLSSSPEVLAPVINDLALNTSVGDLAELVEVTSPPETVLLQVAVQDRSAVRASTIADAVSVELGKTIEALETPRGRVASRVKVSLTEPAIIPDQQSSPRVLLNLLLGAVAGAALGVIIALLRHYLDRRIKSAEDVRTITGMSPLGSVLASRKARNEPLVTLDHRSLAAERYRAIRTALRLAYVDRELHHFVVSSPLPAEGKTTVTANLGISWAQAGAKVCLVDASLHRPMLGRILGLDGRRGLSDVLVGDVDLEDALVPWRDGLLTVLPAGSSPPDPAGLLGSQAATDLVADLRSRFDVVIYDAPPMTAVTDALVLARIVNGLVLVVRAAARRDGLAACVDTVREARLNLLGTVRFAVKVSGKEAHPYYDDEADWKPARASGQAKKAAKAAAPRQHQGVLKRSS